MNRLFLFIMALFSAWLLGGLMIAILPAIIIISMISIIGIPLGIALMVLPTLYAYLVLAGAICWLLHPSWRSFAIGALVSVGLGILVPGIINYEAKSQLDTLSSSQFLPDSPPTNLPAIWVLEEEKPSRISETFLRCSNLCLYLLYEKAAPMVGSRLIIEGEREAVRYYAIEKRARCDVPRFMNSAFDNNTLVSIDRIKQRIATGECLVERNLERSDEGAPYVLASYTSASTYINEATDMRAGPLNFGSFVVTQIEGEKETPLLTKVFYSGGMLAQPLYFTLEGGSQLKTWFVLARSYFVSDENGQPKTVDNLRTADHDSFSPVPLLKQYGLIK